MGSGNAHANRQRRRPSKDHAKDGMTCWKCEMRPKEGRKRGFYRNSTSKGRHNPGK